METQTKTKKLFKHDFERELLKIPAATKKLTNKTARKKVSDIIDKYDNLISYSQENKDWYETKYYDILKKFKAIKSGVINYDGGYLLINQISSVKTIRDSIWVQLKNGKEMEFGMEFNYIIELF
jgi:hypothetical protein